jgi:hypothetical protein
MFHFLSTAVCEFDAVHATKWHNFSKSSMLQ